ncbi:addiction module toxin RelE [Geothermobacter hydrogeniphilus]|uniref:Addiction module toxin RelE n=1 Tax=Geothermobacter hydrogeniphilus TaxID=1969733 RepID=A0A2K2HDN8_9BACT|nr:type II toxin-antitoxin system HigB family toxin [Geothermobacter hydrogeniphilus]PNU21369.1 addiction module toxin RelE [Geothermobacter hydrogeniphilus]
MNRIIAKRTLREFWKSHPDSEEALKSWHAEAKAANWQNPAEIKAQYRSASVLKDSRVVFNICGNKYRLIVKINYAASIVLIRFIGTHKEYDAIDAETV